MSDPLVYDSRSVRFKSPYGAVPSGTQVTFTLRPLRSEGYSRGKLTARLEQRDNQIITVELPWTDTELGRDAFSGVLDTGDYVGLVWYTFQLETITGRRWNIKEEYQLTVYDGSEIVPRWFGEGVSYQIFPDRFRRTRVPDPAGLVGGRTVHQSWQEEPEYRPDANGEIRNRDFFGGDLRGVIEELDYLQSLGVETLYFNPIFEAAENHRYGTADYSRVDPMLGTNEDFSELCRQAHRRGMRVMLDGVFNHTGFVSRYFNGDGYYPEPGAVQSESSPYRPWFQFRHWPDQYESWWGIYTLPAVEESCPGYREFIFGDENSVVRRWLRLGASGWRLDVADELPDSFIRKLNAAARREKSDALIIGEVWEDASNKISYSERRRYFQGGELDSVMNYPLRDAIFGFLNGGTAEHFAESMECIRENYPRDVFYNLMNVVGTHDTARALTLLGVTENEWKMDRNGRAHYQLPPDRLEIALRRLRMAAVIQFTMPGSPTIYYGDEAGQQGFEDPFNRQTYPWGHENQELLAFYRRLCEIRAEEHTLADGDLQFSDTTAGALLRYERTSGDSRLVIAVNRGHQYVETKIDALYALDLLSGEGFAYADPDGLIVSVPPETAYILRCVNAAD